MPLWARLKLIYYTWKYKAPIPLKIRRLQLRTLPSIQWKKRIYWDLYYNKLTKTGQHLKTLRSLSDEGIDLVQFLASQGRTRVWFPGCGVSHAPWAFASCGFDVVATDISQVAIKYSFCCVNAYQTLEFKKKNLSPYFHVFQAVHYYLPYISQVVLDTRIQMADKRVKVLSPKQKIGDLMDQAKATINSQSGFGTLWFTEHDFLKGTTHVIEPESFDSVINVWAIEGYIGKPEDEIKRNDLMKALQTHYDALRPGYNMLKLSTLTVDYKGGLAIFHLHNPPPVYSLILSHALDEIGFLVPDKWCLDGLKKLNIPFDKWKKKIVFKTPEDKQKMGRIMHIANTVFKDYHERKTGDANMVKELANDKNNKTKIALVRFSQSKMDLKKATMLKNKLKARLKKAKQKAPSKQNNK